MTTLQEALEMGQGIERPFRCSEHDDTTASASVNVLKGYWYCFVCQAKGTVDNKKAPSLIELGMMMDPEKTCRVYPEAYLDLFTVENAASYWSGRFPDWLVWWSKLGEDPMTGESTFPVHTPKGLFAGVGRRQTNEAVAAAKEAGTNPSRYKYPRRWSASRTMHSKGSPCGPVLVLVEGAADAISLWEVGIPAYAVYGSGLHHPQIELVLRAKPKLILLGMDNDEAGDRGAALSFNVLKDVAADVARVKWGRFNDPAEAHPKYRQDAVSSVAGIEYVESWQQAAAEMQTAYATNADER